MEALEISRQNGIYIPCEVTAWKAGYHLKNH